MMNNPISLGVALVAGVWVFAGLGSIILSVGAVTMTGAIIYGAVKWMWSRPEGEENENK